MNGPNSLSSNEHGTNPLAKIINKRGVRFKFLFGVIIALIVSPTIAALINRIVQRVDLSHRSKGSTRNL